MKFLSVLLLMIGCFAAALAQDAVLEELRGMISSGKAAAAITKLQGMEKTPGVKQLLGVAYYNANQHVRAIEQLSSVLEKLPRGSAAWREGVQLLGLSHFILGHMAEAVPFLEQTRAWLPNNNELTYALGMAAIQTRQPDKAREAFGRMFRVPADSASAHLLTAQMMVRVEMEEFAEAELKKALEKDPRLPQANYLLGQNAIYKGRYEEGIALMEKELAVNPDNANAHYKIGDALTRQLKYEEAIAALQKSVWLNPYYSGPFILLGKCYLKRRELANAEGMLRRAIQFDPNNKSAHYMLAQVYRQSGRDEDAKREFAIAEKLQGSNDSP